ncbi:MAG: hypothetical protein R6X19_08140 [Kiritimatiellia bacterium]
MMKWVIQCLLIFAAGAILAADGTGGDFSRYSVIMERQPFGLPPSAAAQAEGGAPVAADSFASHVRLTVLMQEDGGQVRVGFVDKKQKDKLYMLAVGEREDDYEVLEANLPEEMAKIRKGAEEQWLSMKAAGAVGAPPPLRVMDIRPSDGSATGMISGLRRQTRYAALRRAEIEREKLAEDARKRGVFREPPDEDDDEEEVTPPPPPPDVEEEDDDEGDNSGEIAVTVAQPGDEDDEEDEADEDQVVREAEIQQHLQNYQKVLIKEGLPPLPVPLTAKTDAELVKAGVLQPLPAADDEDEE